MAVAKAVYISIHSGTGKWLNTGAYVSTWSRIKRLMVCASFVPFTLTMLTIHLLTADHRLAPASVANWFNKGQATCCHVLCDDACKRFLAICCKSRASCPVSRLLSVPI